MKKVMSKIKAFFSRDLLWKSFSLVLAVFLWFVVMNILNPTEVKTFSVNLSFTNEGVLKDNDLIIMNKAELEETKVNVKIRGTRPALDELSKSKNKGNIRAYINLSQLDGIAVEEPTDLSLVVTPALPTDIFLYSYEIVSCSPKAIDVKVDNIHSETMKLQLDVSGEPKSGYNASSPITETDTVRITGPESLFATVASVRAGVDISGKDKDVNVSVAPAVYDKDGTPIKLFTVLPSVIDVTINISRQWQIPVVQPKVTGTLNENLVLKSIEYSPKTIDVEGTIEDINKVQNIELPPVDLSQIENTKEIKCDIRPSLKGTDLKLKSGTPTRVTIIVTVEAKVLKNVTLTENDMQLKGVGNGLQAKIEDVAIPIYGEEKVLQDLGAAQLKPVVDVTGLGVGLHNVPLDMSIPENVQIKIKPTVRVMITELGQTSEPEPSTEEETVVQTENEPQHTEEQETDLSDETE